MVSDRVLQRASKLDYNRCLCDGIAYVRFAPKTRSASARTILGKCINAWGRADSIPGDWRCCAGHHRAAGSDIRHTPANLCRLCGHVLNEARRLADDTLSHEK